MDNGYVPHLTHVDRLPDGVVIMFNDGRCALYSATLLYAMFSRATELNELDDEE